MRLERTTDRELRTWSRASNHVKNSRHWVSLSVVYPIVNSGIIASLAREDMDHGLDRVDDDERKNLSLVGG